jgi:hypothetical protein
LLIEGTGQLQKMETYPLPDKATFRNQFEKSNVPCKFEIPATWGAHDKWSLEWLKEHFGHLDVSPILYSKDDFHTAPKTAQLLLSEYISSLVSGDASGVYYISAYNLLEHAPVLKTDLEFPVYEITPKLARIYFWMGVDGSRLHADYAHNLFAQIRGRKRFLLYAPDREPSKYPCHVTWYSCFSLTDYKNAASSGIPPLSEFEPNYDIIVNPGELLFLPYGWWHQVSCLDVTISVNKWWMTPQMVTKRAGPRLRDLWRNRQSRNRGMSGGSVVAD